MVLNNLKLKTHLISDVLKKTLYDKRHSLIPQQIYDSCEMGQTNKRTVNLVYVLERFRNLLGRRKKVLKLLIKAIIHLS